MLVPCGQEMSRGLRFSCSNPVLPFRFPYSAAKPGFRGCRYTFAVPPAATAPAQTPSSGMTVDEAIALIRPINLEGGVWADLGAGTGLFLRALLRLLGRKARIVAVDQNPRSLKPCCNRVNRSSPSRHSRRWYSPARCHRSTRRNPADTFGSTSSGAERLCRPLMRRLEGSDNLQTEIVRALAPIT